MLKNTESYLIRGYDAQDRIVYGSGQVTKTAQIELAIKNGFSNSTIDYYHMRSASNNCFQAKVTRSD